MANSSVPILDLVFFDTHSSTTLAIGDASVYPTGWNISTPTIEITVPSYPAISIPFVASSVQLYNSNTLGITTGDQCTNIPLPDGLYKVKYSIYPAYLYYVEKTFLRVDQLMAALDDAWLKLDLFHCADAMKYQERQQLELIETYVNGAISAANKCANKAAVEWYNKAFQLITKFINNSTSCLNSPSICHAKW